MIDRFWCRIALGYLLIWGGLVAIQAKETTEMSEAEQFIAELKALEAEQEKRAKEGERGLSDETKKKLEALPTNYGFTAQVESQHCIFYVNDIPLYSTLDDYPDAPKSPTTFAFSFGYAVGSVMENGINEIKIRVIGDIKNPDAHQQFCYFELSGEKTELPRDCRRPIFLSD